VLPASCHCGAVRLEIARKPRHLTECNCSICRRYGAQWAYYTHKTARVLSPHAATSVYYWGDHTLEFHRCKRCGCVTHHQRTKRRSDSTLAVNARMMEPDTIAGVRIRKLDGASTWKLL
jgi:hypothetical protein